MVKNILVFLIILIVLGGAAYYFLFYQNRMDQFPSAAKAVPEDAFLVYKGHEFRQSFRELTQTAMWRGIHSQPQLLNVEEHFRDIDSLIKSNKEVEKLLIDHALILSLHPTSMNTTDLLMTIQSHLNEVQFQDVVKNWFPDASFNKRLFQDFHLYEVKNHGQSIFTFAEMNGIISISKNAVLVEDAIRALKEHQQVMPDFLRKVEQSEDKWIVNFPQMPHFLSTLLASESRRQLRELNLLSGAGVYDLNFTGEEIHLYGTINKEDSAYRFLDLMQGQNAASLMAPQVIPSRAALFFSISLSDPKEYYDQLTAQIEAEGEWLKFQSTRDSLEKAENFSVEGDFLKLLGDELSFVVNEPVSERFSNDIFLAMHFEDAQSKVDEWNAFKDQLEADEEAVTAPENYRGHIIQRMAIPEIFPLLFGRLFNSIKRPFYVQVDDFILFSDHVATLKRVIDDNLADQTLQSTPEFVGIRDNLLSETNVTFFVNPPRAVLIPMNFLRNDLEKKYRVNFPYYRKFHAFVFQAASEDGGFFSQISAFYGGEQRTTTEMVWKKKLEDRLVIKPEIVINHDTRDKEIFLADEAKRIMLLTASGNTLWSRTLDSRVQGAPRQVDLYRNDKLQYVFVTRKQLHLIDRIGRDVANFPIRLGAPAATELSVFDYIDNQKYRYFAGSENEALYGYYANGKPLPGWSPMRLDGVLASPLKYFIYRNYTYLTGATENGAFYLWDRAGDNEYTPHKLNTSFRNELYVYFGEDEKSTFLTTTDTAGITYKFYLDGRVEQKEYGNFGTNHYFNYFDIDEDGEKEFIFAENTGIAGFNPDSSLSFSITLADSLQYPPQFFEIGGRQWIGYVSIKTNQIFLVDMNGTFYPGFPLKGYTPFVIDDVNQDGELELLVQDRDNMLYLYKLQ